MHKAYPLLCTWLESRIGLTLGPDRAYLVQARLTPVLVEFDLPDLQTLVQRLSRAPNQALEAAVIEAMSTHETLWFRDGYPFELLARHLIPTLTESRQRLRFWSAACSTGQEAYSMAMVVAEFRARHPTLASVQDEIVGTDVAALSIDAARRARFVAPGGLRGLAQRHQQQFFHQVPAGFELDQAVRSRTRFLVHNLLDRPEALGKFDVIFLRNVLIYMNEDVQRVVLERVLSALAPGGYLLLGAVGRLPRSFPKLSSLLIEDHVVYRAAN